ncbi:ATP-grasp domain-containing protein [Oceanobacillus oncorhynchi]|uniref:ATP-grasp domain-containing protein n=1 Tax=Oceanobacillus oncorhynchi TaxID=545501 RepID=UPI0034D477F3
MNLFEYEGKKILEQNGICVPKGFLSKDKIADITFPIIAKAQVLTGGRGKAGGVKKVNDRDELEFVIEAIAQKTIKGEKVQEVYLEEIVSFKQEFYLSILMDRNKKSPIIIASRQGGMEIESVPKDQILVIEINPLLGLQDFMVRRLSNFLQVDYKLIYPFMKNIWSIFKNEKAELIEINPLFLDENDRLVAGDAKVSLEESEGTDEYLLIERDRGSFSERCRSLKAAGVDIGGDIAIVASGAGLGMATLDIIKHKGGSVNSLVDLQGHVIHNLDDAKTLIEEIKSLNPKAYLFNFYFQLASCKVLAEAISSQLGQLKVPIVIRMKGLDMEEAREKLEAYPNIIVEENLEKACESLISIREGGSKCLLS